MSVLAKHPELEAFQPCFGLPAERAKFSDLKASRARAFFAGSLAEEALEAVAASVRDVKHVM